MRLNQSINFQSIKVFLFAYTVVKALLGFIALGSIVLFYPKTRLRILTIKLVCWSGRVTNIKILEELSQMLIKKIFLKNSKDNVGTLVSDACLQSNFFLKATSIYSIEYNIGKVSLFRDMIILKEKSEGEKGVILIKYTPAFDAFYYYFDIDKILNDYFLVLEPSWAGACDASFLMYWRKHEHSTVIIQALEPKDYKFIAGLGGNLVPIQLGSSDWVDQDVFCSNLSTEKIYDLVMVSNWGIHKKHKELFKALSQTRMKLSVLLIGFPWGGRTKSDIEREIKEFELNHIKFEIKENISATEVAELLNKSKVYLLLSNKEGGNKSIIEAFFADVPAILYEKFIGGIQTFINSNTGVFSSYADLKFNIEYMVNNYTEFSPRRWICQNSGSKLSTNKLNMLLKSINHNSGGRWSCDILEKVNSPNLGYKNKSEDVASCYTLYCQYKR